MSPHQHTFFENVNRDYILDDDTDLADQITLLAAQINAATYRFLKLVAEFDRRCGWSGAGVRSCAHWLNWQCGIGQNAASERVRIAHCLEQLPQINVAFKSGELSYSKVRAMTRVATDDNEDYLLTIAKNGTASHIEKLVRKFQRVEKNEAKDLIEQQYQERSLVSYQDDDGTWNINIKLPQEEGGLVVKAIDELMFQRNKPLTNSFCKDESLSAETEQIEPDMIETASFPQQRADAFSAIFEHYLATATGNSEEGLKPLAGNERCQVVLHLDAATLKQAHDVEHSSCDCDTCHQSQTNHTPPNLDKQWISLENAKRFSCDASLLTVLEDENGNILNSSRKTRIIGAALKRALNVRDEACRFPGCCESKYVDFHHIKHWANHGETKIDNLIKLCRFHHRALHSGLYNIEIKAPQVFVFKTSTGEVMEPNPRLPKCTAKDFFRQQWPDINSHTGDSQWQGESMDYGMAIDELFYRRQQHY